MALITGAFIEWYSSNYGGNDCAGGSSDIKFGLSFDRASHEGGDFSTRWQ